MKISDDQNVVEIDGVKYIFVKGKCSDCYFYKSGGKGCERLNLPCYPVLRDDDKYGYFKRMEE